LATGTGLIGAASMGSNKLYLSVLGTTGNSLLALDKAGTVQTLESTTATTLSTVLTSRNGVHQLWRLTDIGSAAPGYAIEMLDELGAKHYTASGGFPMGIQDAATVDFNLSESRSRFVFATGYGARGFADAPLVVYDTATKAATTLGTLPGASDFGTDPVYASITSSSTDFMAGFASRLVSGAIQATGAKTLSFNATTPGSLK
jgi:hypothetical protein